MSNNEEEASLGRKRATEQPNGLFRKQHLDKECGQGVLIVVRGWMRGLNAADSFGEDLQEVGFDYYGTRGIGRTSVH